MEKYDLKKAHKDLFAPSAKAFVRVEVPQLNYLAIDGHGDPNTSTDYVQAIESLYPVAYALKFASKRELGRDFVVGPLEGLWRADDPAAFTSRAKDQWDWTMMIAQPDWITSEMVSGAVEGVLTKKQVPAAQKLEFRSLTEGDSVQILHLGSYDDEGPTLDELHHRYLPDNGLTFNGDHHEIYLSDARRTEPSKLRTVLRQPVRPIA